MTFPERLRDCSYRLADCLLRTDRIECAIPYIHRLQELPGDDWMVGLGFLIRRMLKNCQAHQVRKIIYLLDEHCLFGEDFFELEQSLLRHVEFAWNRHGTKEQSDSARKYWLSRVTTVEQESEPE